MYYDITVPLQMLLVRRAAALSYVMRMTLKWYRKYMVDRMFEPCVMLNLIKKRGAIK